MQLGQNTDGYSKMPNDQTDAYGTMRVFVCGYTRWRVVPTLQGDSRAACAHDLHYQSPHFYKSSTDRTRSSANVTTQLRGKAGQVAEVILASATA